MGLLPSCSAALTCITTQLPTDATCMAKAAAICMADPGHIGNSIAQSSMQHWFLLLLCSASWLSSCRMQPSAWRLCSAAVVCLLLPATALSQMLATPDRLIVVSVGTRKRPELQQAQKQTFGKHLETWFYDEVDSLLHSSCCQWQSA